MEDEPRKPTDTPAPSPLPNLIPNSGESKLTHEQRQKAFRMITTARLEGLQHRQIRPILEQDFRVQFSDSGYWRLRKAAAKWWASQEDEDRDELIALFKAEYRALAREARKLLKVQEGQRLSPAAVSAAQGVLDGHIKFYQSLGIVPKNDVQKVELSGEMDIAGALERARKKAEEAEKKNVNRTVDGAVAP